MPDEPLPGATVPAGFSCGANARLAPSGGGFAGCEDLHVTPGYPLTIRLLATLYVD